MSFNQHGRTTGRTPSGHPSYGPPQVGQGTYHRIARPTQAPVVNAGGYQELARWLHWATQGPQQDPWQLYGSPPFARLWYQARDAGERLRAHALERLYTLRPEPGGDHPDPRLPAAFSQNAVISAAARLVGLHVRMLPAVPSSEDRYEKLGRPLAWIQTFPASNEADIMCRHTISLEVRNFEIAMLLGYWQREYRRLVDAESPRGVIRLVNDPPMQALLHQFAKALLCLDHVCPVHWKCPCNLIFERYNALPPGHEFPTQVFDVAGFQRHMRAIADAPLDVPRPRDDAEQYDQLQRERATQPINYYEDEGEPSDPSHPGLGARR